MLGAAGRRHGLIDSINLQFFELGYLPALLLCEIRFVGAHNDVARSNLAVKTLTAQAENGASVLSAMQALWHGSSCAE